MPIHEPVLSAAVSVTPIARPVAPDITRNAEAESCALFRRLRADGAERDQALVELRELLLKAARFEIRRRAGALPHVRGGDEEDLAQQSADDALVAVLGKLADFRGDSRFTTWAYKFALLEAAVKLRRRAWQGREIPIQAEDWSAITDPGAAPDLDAESGELLSAIRRAIDDDLTAHQREVLVALTLNNVPIDVLADRLGTTRGALYKTVHDARRKLRGALAEAGLPIEDG